MHGQVSPAVGRTPVHSNDRYSKKEAKNKMEEKKNLLTHEEYQALVDERNDLKVNKMHEVAEKIKVAREQGDLSENAEYDAAKDEQRDIQARIEEIDAILKNAEVVDDDEGDEDTVGIGSTVKLKIVKDKKEVTYKIVGSTGANVLEGKISNESPIGVALTGAKVGDTITVEAPVGEIQYKVLEISKTKKG